MTRRKPKRESLVDGLIREAAEHAQEDAERARVQAAERLRQRNAVLERRVRDLESEIAGLQDMRDLVATLEANPLEPYTVPAREKRSRKHEAAAMLLLSDLHFEERVDPAEINGINEFNLTIAAERMARLAVGVSWLLTMTRADGGSTGYVIRDLILPCLGDVITNHLRVEDTANFLSPFDAVIFAEEQIVTFVRAVLAACPWIERVYLPMVPGNHDRISWSRTTPFRGRIENSLAVVLAHGLRRELRDDPRVRVELSKSEHLYWQVFGKTIRGMHGDRFSYQGGVGGIFVPARRHIGQLNKVIDAVLTVFGHWHTSKKDDDWISNGSLIGANAYSIAKGLDPEPPAQTFVLLDKLRGVRLCTPVQCDGKDQWS